MFQALCASIMCERSVFTKLHVSLNPKAQLQDAKRRWEELQNYIHSVNSEREKLQASKQGEET